MPKREKDERGRPTNRKNLCLPRVGAKAEEMAVPREENEGATTRVVHCYGQTPEMQESIELFYEQRQSGVQGEPPQYARYEADRAWQPTTCGLRAETTDVLRPSDFVAVVNHTNPDIDMDSLPGGHEALPYQDGDFIPDTEPCGSCKEAAPKSWPFLMYASDVR